MFERFTDSARRVVVLAQEEASGMHHQHIGTAHLLLGLLRDRDGGACRVLTSLGAGIDEVRSHILKTVGPGDPNASDGERAFEFTNRAKKALENSFKVSVKLQHNLIVPEHILLGLAEDPSGSSANVLDRLGVDPPQIRKAVLSAFADNGGAAANPSPEGQAKIVAMVGATPPKGMMRGVRGRGQQSSKSPLEVFGTNLTKLAMVGELDPVVGRRVEIERVMQIMSRRSKNNPILTGEPGVGKTAIAEGLATRINEGEAPDNLVGKQLYSVDLAGMVAGCCYRGDFEQRLLAVIQETEERGDVIWFIDEIHHLVGGGSWTGPDASSILKPALAKGGWQTIGATTYDEYRKYFLKDAALSRRFQPVDIGEPSVAETVQILRGLRSGYEAHHAVCFTDEALQSAAMLSDRYISGRFLPDKAIDLIDEAGSRNRCRIRKVSAADLQQIDSRLLSVRSDKYQAVFHEDYERAASLRAMELALLSDRKLKASEINDDDGSALDDFVVDEDDIAEVLAQWTGIPASRVSGDESARLVQMEEELHKRVIGQHDGISAVSRAIRRTRAGLKDPKRPNGSFVFIGPSGVGKTETAKALAEFLCGDEDALIRVDMSEYMDRHTVSRLIGAPPGYVGYDEGGQLTEAVRRKPFSVILFDEIEKAHKDVFNALLQVLDEGRLTDNQGRTVDFKNTVIILTSNVGSRLVGKQSVGFHPMSQEFGYDDMKQKLTDELKKVFLPEFLNRIDEVVVFRQLELGEIKQIIDLLLEGTSERLGARGLSLVVSDDAKEWIAERGYDPALGARPLRRVIQRRVEDPLAERILLGDYASGGTVVVETGADGLEFDVVVTPDGVPALQVEASNVRR